MTPSTLRAWTLLLLAWAGAVEAVNVFTVNSAADPGTGTCDASECTLREAIALANSTANSGGPDEIRFAIPGAGPHRIQLTTSLPSLATPMSVLGYTQPGAAANTDPNASNAQIRVMIDAASVGGAGFVLNFSTTEGEISGLSVVNRAAGTMMLAQGGVRVRGCWFGIEANGTTAGPLLNALTMSGSGGTPLAGGPDPADRNVFANITNAAILNGSSNPVRVQNNLFGLRPDGVTPATVATAMSGTPIAGVEAVGNRIACTSANALSGFAALISGNRIGMVADGSAAPACTTVGMQLATTAATTVSGNTIAYTSTRAISLAATARNVVIFGNRAFDNLVAPIDLGANGHTANDAGDADTGANNGQNYPLLTNAVRVDADTVTVSGTLNSSASTSFRIDFYATTRIDDGTGNLNLDFGDPERLGLSTVTVTTDANGNASFGPQDIDFDASGFIAGIMATATRLDAGSNPVETSELGPVRAAYTPGVAEFVVVNTDAAGAGSFKQLFLEADAHPDVGTTRDRISFAIPGAGPHTITNTSTRFLATAGRIEVDGSTQAGWQANTASVGSNAQLMVDLVGYTLGLNNSPDAQVRGVVLRGASGTLFLGNGGIAEGNFFGLAPDGVTLSATGGNTSQVGCFGSCRVGGSALAARNLIGADGSNPNMSTVILQSANGALVENNLIGLQRNGITRLSIPQPPVGGQGSAGIVVSGTTGGLQILRNTIGGFHDGVRTDTSNARVEGNRIGVGSDDSTPVPNLFNGVHARIGGSFIFRNHIAYNGGDGILVAPSAGTNSLIENRVHDNGGLGIDLDTTSVTGGDGVSPNDPLDVDTFANAGQNYPVLANAVRDADSLVAAFSLNTRPNLSFRLRYCLVLTADPTGHGECDQPLLDLPQVVATNGNGDASGTTIELPYSTGASALVVTASRIVGGLEETSEYSAVVPIRIGTTLSIDSHGPDPSSVGQAFTVQVSLASTDPAVPASGSVAISAPGAGNCVAVISNGSGSCQLTATTAGATTISASYAGNASHAPAATTAGHVIAPAASTTTITADTPDPSTFGDAITVGVSVASNGGAPVGNVVIGDGLGASCNAVLANGIGSCTLVPTQGGALTLSADYAGSSDFLASSDTEPHQVVAVASTLAILADTPDPSVAGQPVNVSVQLSSTVGTPAGPVVVSDGAGASCQVAGASGNCNLIPNGIGAVQLRADFAGNGTHLASTAASPHQIDRAGTSIVAGAPFPAQFPTEPPRQFAALRFPVAVDVTAPGAGTATGTLTVQAAAGPETCVVLLPASSCDLLPQTAGTRSFNISYSGDARFLPANSSVQVEVLADLLHRSGFED